MKCPECGNEMERGYLYIRGLGGSLYWGSNSNTGFFSRRGLLQIDLSRISVVSPAAQAVLEAGRCGTCGTVHFRAFQ
jgi:hypothetical protein